VDHIHNSFLSHLLVGVVLGVGLVGGIGSMMGVFYTPPEKTVQKHLFWLVSLRTSLGCSTDSLLKCRRSMQAKQRLLARSSSLAPLFCLALHSIQWVQWVPCVMSGLPPSERFPHHCAHISLIAMSRNDTYLYMGGPLLAGVTVVALSSLAPMALPLGIRGLAIAEALSLYGGLAVFSGFVLYEYAPFRSCTSLSFSRVSVYSTQKILHNARLAEQGVIPRDPLKESIGLELDFINILYVSPASFHCNCSSLAF
jgi:hypothetical protein